MHVAPLLLLLLPCTASLNILMYVNVVGKSHLQFATKLIALLNERGHTVDAILGMLNSYVTLKGSYGARQMVPVHFPGESPWVAVADHLNNPFSERTDWDRAKFESNKFIETNELLCDLLLDSSEVAALLSSNTYDVALMSGYDFCPFALTHHYKIAPVVSFVPTSLYYHQSYPAGLPELPLYDNKTCSVNVDHPPDTRASTEIQKPILNAKLRARFGDNFPDVREIAMNTSLDFTNSHPLLEESRPVSLRVRFIGGIGMPTPKALSADLNDLLNRAPKGNVIFSFGTQIGPEHFSVEQRQAIVNTFKRFPEYNFLWKFDGKTVFNASNIFNMEWLPQTDLLYDPRVVAFISHMGLNSLTEAAFAGVPVVAIPIFLDQHINAKRAVALGMAELVRKTEITEESLSRALEQVLFDERYRNRARETAAMISALPDTPQRIFLEEIEFTAKFKNLAPHYRLAGANHNFLVQNGWDVAAFLTLLVILAVLFAGKFVTAILKHLRVQVPEKKKIH